MEGIFYYSITCLDFGVEFSIPSLRHSIVPFVQHEPDDAIIFCVS